MRSVGKNTLTPRLLLKIKTLGEHISIARRKRNWTQSELAERCRLSLDTIKRAEKGVPTLSFAAMIMILDRLGKSSAVDELLKPELDMDGNQILENSLPKRIRRKGV